MASPFIVYLAEHHPELKNRATELGRRRAKLSLLEGFWALPVEEKERLARLAEDPESQEILSRALEDFNELGGEEEAEIAEYVDEASVAGVVVRTDYSDDAAWTRFIEVLLDAEKDLMMPVDDEGIPEATGSTARADHPESESEDEEVASPQTASPSNSSSKSLFAIISAPVSSRLRARLTGISNLAALHLFNEVDAVRAPVAGASESKPVILNPNEYRLTNAHGFVEAYSGPLVWVYDARSNADQATRVVSQCAESIGTATADSWRARATFLPELQLNLVSGALKIDFGGLDRWDHGERQRNIADACFRLI